MKSALAEIKHNLQGISNRVDEADRQISNLEYKEAESTQSEQQKWKKQKPMKIV